jgi:hypothetical protein
MQLYSQQQQATNFQQMPLRIQEPHMYRQDLSFQEGMPQSFSGGNDMNLMLTRAGVSNFAQQMQQIGQQLQYLMERLHFAQNQVQTQAEAQLRELQQIQQAVAMTVQQLQQAQMSGNMQPNLMQ